MIFPLAIMWFTGTIVITGVSRYFTQKAFDRALLDDAYAVASHVRVTEGNQLGVRGTEKAVSVVAQASLIDGILDNLIDNSLRYGKPLDGSTPSITLAIDTDQDGSVSLSVLDNGSGINRSDWERVTERWFKGQAAKGQRLGAGLGLYLVSEYCRIIKAELTLESVPGFKGTCIKLEFKS